MTRTDSTSGKEYVDLMLVVTLVAGTTAALLSSDVSQALGRVLGVPFLLVAPGYTIVAALFPTEPGTDGTASGRQNPPGWIVRLALALVGSVLIIGAVSVSLSFVGRLRLVTAVIAIDVVVTVGVVAAWYRRRAVAARARSDPFSAVPTRRLPNHLALSNAQTLVFVISVLVLVSAVAFVGATPAPTDAYSEVALLDSDRTLLGSNETATLENGTENALVLQIENHEGSDTTYGIVGQLQQVGANGTVLYTWDVDRDSVTVADGARVEVERGINSPTTAGRVSLRYLVYTGSIPDDPSGANADLLVRQWIDVVPEGSA